MQPYLESLPNYIDGAPPWTPTNKGHEITSWPLKHYLEISPRDFKELRTDTDQTYSINKVMHIIHITSCHPPSTHPHSFPNIQSYQLIFSISYQYHVSLIPSFSFKLHAKSIPNPSFTIHESHHSYITIHLIFLS